ncbi:MAG TPA: MazG family protein [Mycobacteriales bacterium]|nr:MazG family protein [Mycobacteriales bacterium]
MSLTVVTVSPRVAPGLLALPAWDALRAGPVRCLDAEHPQLPALAAAGIAVEIVEAVPADGVLLCGETVPDGVGGEVLPGSWDLPGARLLDAVAVMDRLRSPGGCPWDAEQTHRSLMPYLLEEAYEAYQSLEDEDDPGLREELGDLLLQVLFHARLAEEHADGGAWSIDDVATELVDKLVSRHPHVFAADPGDEAARGIGADEVNARWEELKAEQKGRTSVTDGVPLAMAALSLAAKLQRRADKAGVTDADFDAGPGLGAELWGLVARARAEGIDPEEELRTVARAYRDHLLERGH